MITVTYKGVIKYFPIIVQDPITSITAVANKTVYKYGEDLNITVTGIHASGLTTDVTGMVSTDFDNHLLGSGQVVTVSYGTAPVLTDTVIVDVVNYVDHIVFTAPAKNTYSIGDAIDYTGGSIQEIMADGSIGKTVDLSDCTVTGYDMRAAGIYQVKVQYTDSDGVVFTEYYPITVVDSASSINIGTAPKTEYNYGDSLDTSIGTIVITRASGEQEEVSLSDPRITITGYNPKPAGYDELTAEVPETLTITFTEVLNGETFIQTENYEVTVKDVSTTQIIPPAKVAYIKGEGLDVTGGIIQDVGASGVIRNKRNVTVAEVTGYDANTLGGQRLTITYNGATKTYDVTVTNAVISIGTEKTPKTTFVQGESIDVSGGTIIVVKQNGEEIEVPITLDMISGYDPNKIGQQIITITYQGKKVQYIVEVTAPVKPIATTAPAKENNTAAAPAGAVAPAVISPANSSAGVSAGNSEGTPDLQYTNEVANILPNTGGYESGVLRRNRYKCKRKQTVKQLALVDNRISPVWNSSTAAGNETKHKDLCDSR
ncbi:MAG: bacterial Ig-like domain-containing protein [Firmicutes bacterium]|nr:bacterial Ig-like domain-containing protein [Bacillota bacterium]